jgi:moderate conductance mechanosensitive channel
MVNNLQNKAKWFNLIPNYIRHFVYFNVSQVRLLGSALELDFVGAPLLQNQVLKRVLNHALVFLVSFLIVCNSGAALGQTPEQTSGQTSGQIPRGSVELPLSLRQLETNLTDLNNLLSPNSSGIARAVIWLDGRQLFTIAAPAITEQSQQSETMSPVESRVEIIQERLRQVVNRGFEPDSLQVTAETDPTSRQPVIFMRYRPLQEVSESTDADQSDPQSDPNQSDPNQSNQSNNDELTTDELMTVTALDAEANGTNLQTQAKEISEVVERALLRAQQERQPRFLQQQGLWAAAILLAVGLGSSAVTRWQQHLHRERRGLAQSTLSSATLADPGNAEAEPQITTALLQQRAVNQQKQRANDVKRRLLQIVQMFLWSGGFVLLIGLFPYTRWLRPLIATWVQIPIRVLIVVLVTYLAIRMSETVIDRLFWALQSSTSLASSTPRLILRFTTFSRVAKSIAVIVLGTVGLMVAVAALGITINPGLITFAGIAGVGISLASQNLIKDVINGFLILLEDQYGVGDVVKIGEMSGFVENMNLRITQLRSSEGHLITVPNSSITVVQNLSKEWSRVDISVSVAYEADLDQALAVIDQVAQTLSTAPNWRDLILETPQMLGVENLDSAGATVRLWIKTQPLKQWEVAREYRRRLKLAFDRAGISIGVPQQSLWLSNADMEEAGVRLEHPNSQPPKPPVT